MPPIRPMPAPRPSRIRLISSRRRRRWPARIDPGAILEGLARGEREEAARVVLLADAVQRISVIQTEHGAAAPARHVEAEADADVAHDVSQVLAAAGAPDVTGVRERAEGD